MELLKKKSFIIVAIFVFVLILISIWYAINYDPDSFSICLPNGCVINQATDNLHAIYLQRKISTAKDNGIRLIRGFIKGYSVYTNIVVGYLSTEYFEEMEIDGMEGPNDVEGYFIIDTKTENVLSGLRQDELESLLKNKYLIEKIKPLKEIQHVSQLKCILPSFLR